MPRANSTVSRIMMRLTSSAVVVLLASVLLSHSLAQTSLSKDSPFLPAAGSALAPAPSNSDLSFTGVSGSGNTAIICIQDAKAKRSYWIPVGSTTEGIKILSFDAARDQVTLTVGGEQKQLALRRATIAVGSSNPGIGVSPVASTLPTPTPTQGTQQPPPVIGSIAHQESEARMLVSDLLEIGMQQRKAYEEAQKKAEAEKAEKQKKS